MSDSRPDIGVIMLHPGCNMTCTFCVTENTMDAMSLDQAAETVDVAWDRGVRNVVFGGGEPFAWPEDLLRLAGHARQRGMFVQVGTNGIGLPADYATIETIDRFVLPLDGAVGVVPLDLLGRRAYSVDLIGLTLWNDGFGGPSPALVADVTYHALVVIPGLAGRPEELLHASGD